MKSTLRLIYKQRFLFLMSVPMVLWLLIFSYLPLWGWTMAFQNYKLGFGFFQQHWVGFDNFVRLLSDKELYTAIRNTAVMGSVQYVIGFTLPIIFAILINELRSPFFKRTIQTISYLPHFVSWVIIAGIVSKMLSTDGGAVNALLLKLHILKDPVQFLSIGKYFWAIAISADTWKELGWSTIIYLAAISGISAELYEATRVDGAGRFRQIWHVTLPGIRPTLVIMMVMSAGWLLTASFDRSYLLGNNLVLDYSEVLDIYAYNFGVGLGQFSFATAISVFQSVISVTLLLITNTAAKKLNDVSLI